MNRDVRTLSTKELVQKIQELETSFAEALTQEKTDIYTINRILAKIKELKSEWEHRERTRLKMRYFFIIPILN